VFSEKVILEKLANFTEQYGWTPVRHSIEEIEKASAYIQSLLTTDARGDFYFDNENWTPKLVRFVQNERAMCAMDCEYYLTRYYKIAANNRIVRFQFRSGQRVVYRVIQELEEQGRGIEIQALKARQQGITTLIEGIMSHRALFVPGAKCSIASADSQKTYVMMGMIYTAIDHIPWWLSPVKTKDKRSGSPILEFSNIGTSVVIQSGTMKGGIGQGTTPTAIHLSEVCDYTDPVTQIEEGLFMAVHSGPEIFMVLESTGNGNTGWWADQWRNNKENYHKGLSRLLPLFLPWFMTPELFPPPDFREHHPVPSDWKPAEETLATTYKCEAYANNTPILSRILGKGWKLPIEQQWFWEWKFMDARRRRVEKSWLRQMPCDDYEALIGDHDSVVGRDTLDLIEKSRQKICQVYGVLGEGIAERHEPPPMFIDPHGDRIFADWKTPKEEKLEWWFMPYLDCDIEKKDFNPLKKLLIWEHPSKNCDYSIGCDTGTGVGGDRSVISVGRTGYDASCDVQVAEFASDDISNVELYAWVAAISAYYSQFMEEGRHPKLIIEQKRKYGDTCQHQLNLMGMRRHHEFVTYDKKTLRPKGREGSRLGWFTNEWSRPMLLQTFKYAIEGSWFIINSPSLKEEVEGWEQQFTLTGKTKMDHQTGKHDDRIFAAAMAYFTMHDLDIMIERAKKKFNKPDEEGYIVDYGPFHHQANIGGEWLEAFGNE
jgi:hypothetical protein